MSILLHGAKPSNQILPQEHNRRKWSFWRTTVANFITFRLFINIIFEKTAFLKIVCSPQTFYPNLPIFVHGYMYPSYPWHFATLFLHIASFLLCLSVPLQFSVHATTCLVVYLVAQANNRRTAIIDLFNNWPVAPQYKAPAATMSLNAVLKAVYYIFFSFQQSQKKIPN